MIEAKGAMASIAFAGKIYWAGGRFSSGNDPNSNGTNSVEIRDVNAQTSSFSCLFRPNNWYSIPNAPVEKNNTLIFFNGWVEGQGTQTKFDIYDVAANKWAIGVLNKHIYEAAIISVNHTIYVGGWSLKWICMQSGLETGVLKSRL